eukprot:CAMPEP_0170552120 /NCGR_PEP_ID=MMETSP0211-20121228/10072_1 /TAXON_ID=311385 /ORGANISM="Pseudokeronopsis sp., Strain OXSARD2" /LENGTH=162 /DNA_ID=CAMNT_0010859679 /DNA_START=245 /DNA_END=736 /DNA_ORIENTATION=-
MYPEYYGQVGESPLEQIQDAALAKQDRDSDYEDLNEDEGKGGLELGKWMKTSKLSQVVQEVQKPSDEGPHEEASPKTGVESKKDTAYIEGNYDYNIWYDKYLTDRNQMVERAPSLYKCNPQIDTGFTKADKFEKKGSTYFCVYFARGACTEGTNCRFYHRAP